MNHPPNSALQSSETPFDDVLALVEARRGLPLALYRRPMIERRVSHRMRRAGAPDLPAYLARLASDERELDVLVDTVCIKVSRFFRDDPVFDRLGALIREVVALGRSPRIWSAGCGRGEEPYSLSALLDAAGAPSGCRVIATDADPAALAAGRIGYYPLERLEEIPPVHRDRFDVSAGSFGPLPRLRERVVFGALDIGSAKAPPDGGPFDLVLCRNVLIYFSRRLQERALALLAGSLAPGGVLCLGEAEWLSDPAELDLEPFDRRRRLLIRGTR